MFSIFLRTTLTALVAIAAAVSVSATPGLSVKVTGPTAVDGVENLKVVTTVTNTGDETLKLLNDPNSILDTLPTEMFIITSNSGASPDFIGVRAKYSPAQAATSADPWAMTVIAPGTSVSFTHDLSSAYNFTSTGYGTYTVAPSSHFHIVDANNEISEFHADVEPFTTKVSNGKLAIARVQGGIVKRATFNNCSATQQTALNAAATAAQGYALTAKNYLTSNTVSTTRYATWFGNYTTSRHATVLDHFTKISSNNFSSFTYDCTCTNSSFAYVYANNFGTVYLCGSFISKPGIALRALRATVAVRPVALSTHLVSSGCAKAAPTLEP